MAVSKASMQGCPGTAGTPREGTQMTAGSPVMLSYQGLPSTYPMENVKEDSMEGTFVLSPHNQNNKIIIHTLNYLPEKALTDTQVRNHNN